MSSIPRKNRTELQWFDYLLQNAKPEGECLVSHLRPNAKGYIPCQPGGRGSRKQRAHRFVFEILHGKLSEDIQVRHTCDNRACLNPEHLLPGTAAMNSQDMVSRKRQANQHTVDRSRSISLEEIFRV